MPDSQADKPDLMQRVAAGDHAARSHLLEQHGPAVMRLLRYLAGGRLSRAEDAFQETFAAAFQSASSYDPEAGQLRSWLFAIARNQLRAAHRKQVREVQVREVMAEPSDYELGLSAGFGDDAPDQQLSGDEQRDLLAQALASLAADELEVLLLRDLEGIDGEAAAQILGVGLAAMKSRLHRARLKLMAAYRRQEAGVTASEKYVAGLRCRDVLGHLSSYVDGELGSAERAQIEEHLRACSVCERFGGRFSGTVHGLRAQLGADVAIDAELVSKLRTRLAQG